MELSVIDVNDRRRHDELVLEIYQAQVVKYMSIQEKVTEQKDLANVIDETLVRKSSASDFGRGSLSE